jgi:Tfp pilus assembly protein PilO
MERQNPLLRELFKSPERKTYSLAGITALIVGVFALFVLRPTLLKVVSLNREIKDKKAFLSKIEDKRKTLNNLIAEKQPLSEEIAFFEEDFPTETKGGFLVANMSAIAQKFNLDLMNIEFKTNEVDSTQTETELPQNVDYVQVDMTVEGDTNGIESFTEYLEGFPRILDIRSVNYSSIDLSEFREDVQQYKPLSGNIQLYVYMWHD